MGLAGINVLVVLLCKVIIYITINKLRIISMCDPYAYMVAVATSLVWLVKYVVTI